VTAGTVLQSAAQDATVSENETCSDVDAEVEIFDEPDVSEIDGKAFCSKSMTRNNCKGAGHIYAKYAFSLISFPKRLNSFLFAISLCLCASPLNALLHQLHLEFIPYTIDRQLQPTLPVPRTHNTRRHRSDRRPSLLRVGEGSSVPKIHLAGQARGDWLH